MKLVVLIIPFLLFLIRYPAILIIGKQYEMYLDYQWIKFKLDYSKTYDSFEKELHHYKIFQNTIKEINEHNRKYEAGTVTWKEGINQFSDLSEKEFQESGLVNLKYLEEAKVESRYTTKNTHVIKGNAPASIDWRKFGAVTPVRNQGECGSCWAMVATGAFESHYAIKNHKLVQFSVQELLDCDKGSANDGCNGGIPRKAFKYMTKNGLDTEESYPYQAINGTCRKTKTKARLSGHSWVPHGEKNLRNAVGTVGPVTVALRFRPLRSYENGIFKCFEGMGNVTHGGLLVGYGEEKGVPYWLIKNSWGNKWGEKGYLRIERQLRGKNHPDCGIYVHTFYPNVEKNLN